MRNLLIFSIVVLMNALFAFIGYSADYQCDVDGDNRLGLEEAIRFLQEISGMFAEGSNTVLDCGAPDFEITASGSLNARAKEYILCRMNEIRSETALGTTPDDGTDGHYPKATNMKRMQWDDDLATVANNYAARCNWGHNSNRGSEYGALTGLSNPAVGENIAGYWTSSSSSGSAVQAIERAFSGWNGESTNWHYDTINNTSWGRDIGHFTQNVWANSTRVGCGQAWCPDGNMTMYYNVCNYYPAGNYQGQYFYQSGTQVCSVGMQPGDTCEHGLITSGGAGFQCDVNSDGKLGLDEVIGALRVLSGLSLE